jgi:hypothetical protein
MSYSSAYSVSQYLLRFTMQRCGLAVTAHRVFFSFAFFSLTYSRVTPFDSCLKFFFFSHTFTDTFVLISGAVMSLPAACLMQRVI